MAAGSTRVRGGRSFLVLALAYLAAGTFLVLVVRAAALPDPAAGMDATFGPFNAFLQQTTGRMVTTDIQVDYASAVALLHGQDPYGVSAELFDRYGHAYSMPPWAIELANPHPPTTVAMVLPLAAVLSYPQALLAWSVVMVFVVVATVQLMGVRLAWAAPIGVAVSMVWPGAYAIGNVVPLIGLGIALAYRFRDHPLLAALGLTVAAAPKVSGLILALPFLLTGRWKPVAWAAAFMTILAAVPLLFFPATWGRYLDAGVSAVAVSAARVDNASVLALATELGMPAAAAGVLAVGLAVGAALLIKDTFWPTVWLMVALLPIAWMYSLITLVPLFVVAVRRPNIWGVGAVALGTVLAVGSPPLGALWPPRVLPLVLLCALVALLQVRDDAFWPRKSQFQMMFGRRAGPRPAVSAGTESATGRH